MCVYLSVVGSLCRTVERGTRRLNRQDFASIHCLGRTWKEQRGKEVSKSEPDGLFRVGKLMCMTYLAHWSCRSVNFRGGDCTGFIVQVPREHLDSFDVHFVRV